MKKLLAAVVTVGCLGAAVFAVQDTESTSNNGDYTYVTKPVTRGDISNTISATGTLAAVDDVIIGAQLSGQITEVLVDFNDTVSAGQILAQIDARSYQARVDQTLAMVDKTKAEKEAADKVYRKLSEELETKKEQMRKRARDEYEREK